MVHEVETTRVGMHASRGLFSVHIVLPFKYFDYDTTVQHCTYMQYREAPDCVPFCRPVWREMPHVLIM